MSMRQFIFAGFLLAIAFMAVIEARDQSIWAKGTLTCQGALQSGLLVQLWDHDTLDPDDKMGEGTTLNNGFFNVTGWTESSSDIKPYIKYIHNCTTNNVQACSKATIAAEYINEGREPTKVFNAYNVELHSLDNNC